MTKLNAPSRPAAFRPRRRQVLAAGLGAAASGGRAWAAADDEVRVGVLRPLTGPFASTWAPLYLVVDIAIDEVNRSGGILGRKVVKVEVDDEGSPARAPLATQQLIEQGVKMILGPAAGSQCIASLQVSTPRKVIQTGYATTDELGDGTRFPYHYQYCFTTSGEVVKQVEYLARLGIKEFGVLVEDGATGAAAKSAMLNEASHRGMTVPSSQIFQVRTPDMTPFLRKLRSDGAKALDCHVSNNLDVTQLLVGLSRIGWKPPVVGHTGLLFAGTPDAIPASARYNDVFAATYTALSYTDTEKPTDRIQAFVRKITSADVPDSLLGPAATSPYYDALIGYKTAAEKVGSFDSDAIKQALDGGLAVDGLFGTVKFSASGHTAYGSEVVSMVVANSTEEPFSKEFRGLFRRRTTASA